MFSQQLAAAATAIQAHFDAVFADFEDGPLVQAMAYATRGGKRLRGFLVLESARMHDIAPAQAIWPAAAVEAMHGYSLVHDDLPAMDDDDLRRGHPTVHKRWDEATAILAGDALQTMAFDLVTRDASGLDPVVRVDLAQSLARASGAHGMVLGQALDMAAETASRPLTLDEVTHLQEGKTGALIAWSAVAGARMAGADLSALKCYAAALGLAFQIADDILDVTGSSAKTGKAVGKDADAGKATFVSLLGLEESRKRADELIEKACDSLAGYSDKAQVLQEAAQFVIRRQH